MRSQSAMEYLMTYGWAILVIAVVLGVLFQLGVFGNANLAPKATPGSCEVQRTTAGTSLAGMCQGELPQYVAVFGGAANMVGSFSGGFPTNAQTPVTLSAWVYDPSNSAIAAVAAGSNSYGCTSHLYYAGLDSHDSSSTIDYHGCCNDYQSTAPATFNRADGKWHFIAISYSSSAATIAFQVDGSYESASWAANPEIGGQTLLVGQDMCDHWYFTGDAANLQLYNTSLSQAELLALYQEGIGGAPVRPQNIVGWWPLNGNGNDYSGNNNNLQNNGAGFTSFWSSSYSAP